MVFRTFKFLTFNSSSFAIWIFPLLLEVIKFFSSNCSSPTPMVRCGENQVVGFGLVSEKLLLSFAGLVPSKSQSIKTTLNF
jgi:hypothetical protein